MDTDKESWEREFRKSKAKWFHDLNGNDKYLIQVTSSLITTSYNICCLCVS